MKRLLYLACILMAVTACKEVFETPPMAFLQASLLNASTNQEIKSNVTALGVGRDSLWIIEPSISEILLPLSPNDTTSYIISFDAIIDTITFIHETTQKYASIESGFYFEYKLNSIDFTNNRIDSVQIIDSLVTKKWHENIKLYIRPLPADSN